MIQVLFGFILVLTFVFGFVVFRGAPYVPSRRRDLKRAFTELYPLSELDFLVDIGAGDGVVLRQAANCGARALGYELNPVLVLIARFVSHRYGALVTVKLADFWRVKLPAETTLVYTFGESRDIARMYTKVVQEATRLQKPLYFMSYGFTVPGRESLRTLEPCHLYLVEPLQPPRA